MQPTKILFHLITITFIVVISFAQPPESASAESEDEKIVAVTFPYVAEITGDDVNIRSGPGTNWYRCGKLNKSDRVTVVAHEYSWSKILPLPQSFAWISTQYVKLDPDDPSVGVVTGENVQVWAGSVFLEPIHSTSLQTKLKSGDKVRLLGEEKADYYKIVPPTSAHFYVSTEFTKYLGSVEEIRPVEVKPAPEPAKPETPTEEPGKPAEPRKRRPVPPRPARPLETRMLKEYYELAGKVDLERKKPLSQQNYLDLKGKLSAIAKKPEHGKAARYAKFELKVIERFELALQAGRDLQSQDAELAQLRTKIKARRMANLGKIVDLGKFAAIGYLRQSQIYADLPDKQRFIVVDDYGTAVCYAQLDPSVGIDLTGFLHRKVGLVGTIKPDPHTAAALVEFVNVVPIE